MSTEGLIAIAVATASVLFTLYQWLVVMNFRRPHLRFLRFGIKQILINEDYKDFVVFPAMNFIVVNLSDLPNALLSMKMFCRIRKEWHEGRLQYEGAQSDEMFPINIYPHSSESPSRHSVSYSFPIFPESVADWKNMRIRVELWDQYDRVHRLHLQGRDLSTAPLRKIPNFEPGEKLLGEVRHTDPRTSEPVVVRALYVEDRKNPEKSQISVREYGRRNGWGGTSINQRTLGDKLKEARSSRFLYHDLGSCDDFSKRVYVYKDGDLPSELELELTFGGVTESSKMPFPSEFAASFRS